MEMLELIEGLKDEKITIFLSTHILNDAERVCDKICIIDEGRILLTEDLSKLYEVYMQPIFDIEFEKDPKSDLDFLKNFNWVEEIKESIRNHKYLILAVGFIFWALLDPLMLKLLPLLLKNYMPADVSVLFS